MGEENGATALVVPASRSKQASAAPTFLEIWSTIADRRAGRPTTLTVRQRQQRAVTVRELREKTGLLAGHLTHLGTLDVSPSTLSQRCSAILATDLTQGEPQREPEEEDMRSAWFRRTDVGQMVRDGAITDG